MFNFDDLGQEIVEELSRLIHEDIILTDKKGFIKACTDLSRINDYHEGAVLSLRKGNLLLMKEKETKTLEGVRKGVVFPIIIDEIPIAVIGISGEPEKIQPQAQLIKRVVELFIKDSLKRDAKVEKVRELEFFVFDWLTSENLDRRFYERAEILNINVEIYRQVVVMQTDSTEEHFRLEDREYLLFLQIVHPNVKIVRWGRGKIVFLLPDIDENVLRAALEKLLYQINNRMKTKVSIGVGEPTVYNKLSRSLSQAERASDLSRTRNQIVFEHELRFDLLFHDIPKEKKDVFIQRTIAPLIDEPDLLNNISVWLNENQSIQNSAKKLHIHKNTLNYRLKKVEILTGLSVSRVHDLFLIYLGIRFMKEKENSKETLLKQFL